MTTVRAPHVNCMVGWPEIACQRGHDTHDSKVIRIALGGPTGYHDLPQIPERLARSFDMAVFDWEQYRYHGKMAWCPGADAVSETLDLIGTWEPNETILALSVFASASPGSVFLDLGAQIGWFSLLAASYGLPAIAVDADPEPLRLLRDSARLNGWENSITAVQTRITPETEPYPPSVFRLAKLDLEGAEEDAIRMLWPSIAAGLVDHLLVEVSPVFADGYPELVTSIIDAGYMAYTLPPKVTPPHRLDDPERDLTRLVGDVEGIVASWDQASVWFRREDASW